MLTDLPDRVGLLYGCDRRPLLPDREGAADGGDGGEPVVHALQPRHKRRRRRRHIRARLPIQRESVARAENGHRGRMDDDKRGGHQRLRRPQCLVVAYSIDD